MSDIADNTVESTDKEEIPVVTTKEKLSLKEQAMDIIRKRVPNKDGTRVFPITRTLNMFDQVWRPFDDYVKDKWLTHASRLSALRDSPILTPFGKKYPWDQMVAYMARQIKTIDDPQLRAWEQRELKDYGKNDFVRGRFDPIMYLGRILLYQGKWFTPSVELSVNLDIPSFQPLNRISEVEIRSDAKTANVGFPWLVRLSESGQEVTKSPVYLEVLEAASKWRNEILHLSKITPQTVKSISPPIAVFERAQSGGRPVQAVSKKCVFNEYMYSQPLTDATEVVPEYANGDRSALKDAYLKLITGEIHEIAKGDDNAVYLNDGTIVGSDATAMDALVSPQQSNLFANAVADVLTGEHKKVWLACCYAASEVELVCNVGMVSKPSRQGTTSGRGSTTSKNTFITLWRARESSRKSEKQFLSDMNKFGVYRTEFVGKGYMIMLKLFVSEKRPDHIHGSEVRSLGALCQREDPVLVKSKDAFMIEEEARLKAIGGNMYGHPHFEEFATFVKQNWQFRMPEKVTAQKAEQYMSKSRDDDVTGEYEREGIKVFTDLVGG